MGKQMDEVSFRNLGFLYLELFIEKYYRDLVHLLAKDKLVCNVFCLSINRYLQEYIKANELTMLI